MERNLYGDVYGNKISNSRGLTIPEPFRHAFSGQVLVATLPERCLVVSPDLGLITDEIEGAMRINVVVREARVRFPRDFLEHAGLHPGEPVLVSGALNRIEVWNPNIYDRYMAEAGDLNVQAQLWKTYMAKRHN